MWEFLGLESERGVSVCWPNNKIIDGEGLCLALGFTGECNAMK